MTNNILEDMKDYTINEKIFIINECFIEEYNSWDKIDKQGSFILALASSSFESIGLIKQNIVIDKSKLLKILHKHNSLNEKVIKQIPTILDNPVLILKSVSVKGRIVVFGEIFDNYNKPIMLALELNPRENERSIDKVYKVASAYPKTNISGIQKWLDDKENILYVDKKKRTFKWLNSLHLHLPVSFSNNSEEDEVSNKKVKVNIMIKDIPTSERPRERAIKYGIENLTNEELLSIILKTGTKNYSVKYLSSVIISSVKSIHDLRNITINNLKKINGIGEVKAVELLCALELGKRVYLIKEKDRIKLNSSKVIFNYFKDLFINEKQENFYAIYLDSKSKLISYRLLFKGTINSSCVHPREVFKYAFLESAYSIIVMHNHPSGDPSPSIEDEEVTSSLFKIGKLVAIPVVDHIVFGNNTYFSFYEYIHSKDNTM